MESWMTGTVVLFVLFNFFTLMPDSYSHWRWHRVMWTWPVAYSKFVLLISFFTHSDKLFVGFSVYSSLDQLNAIYVKSAFISLNQVGLPQLIILTLLIWLLNIVFNVFASSIVLRYQYFPCWSSSSWLPCSWNTLSKWRWNSLHPQLNLLDMRNCFQ